MSASQPPTHSQDAPVAEASAPLTHEEAIGLLDALHDGELAPEQAARVGAHAAACARCQAVEEALAGGLRKAVREAVSSPPPDLLLGVQRRLHLRSRGRFYSRGLSTRGIAPSPWPLVVASILVLAALVAGYLWIGQVGAP